MEKKNLLILLVIFGFSLALRLFFAFQSPNFSDDSAYLVMRQVEHISTTGTPLYFDPLSYSGRHHAFLPLFHYSLAFFNLFMPLGLVLKIIPNLFASCLVFVVYIITKHLTKNEPVSIFTAAVSSVIPVWVSLTINSASIYTIVLPLMFLTIYFFMRVTEEKRFATHFIVCFFVLAFIHATVFVLVGGFLIYLLLARLEGLKVARAELEVAVFALLFAVWSYFIVFKKLFLAYGTSVFLQNIPSSLLSQYFKEFTILKAINQIGVIPLFAGIYILYRYLFKIKNKSIHILIGFTFSVSLLLWLRMISFGEGMIILGTVLILFLSQFLMISVGYIGKTRLVRYRTLFFGLVIFLFAATSLAPTVFYSDQEMRKAFSDDLIGAMLWLRENSEEGDVVLATLHEGHLVSSIAARPNVVDSDFLLASNVDERLSDVDSIFSTSSEIEAVSLLTMYNVRYLVFSDYAKLKYKSMSIPYVEDLNCFELVYNKEVEVFKTKCKLETVK